MNEMGKDTVMNSHVLLLHNVLFVHVLSDFTLINRFSVAIELPVYTF